MNDEPTLCGIPLPPEEDYDWLIFKQSHKNGQKVIKKGVLK
jgi:hypothetical protein